MNAIETGVYLRSYLRSLEPWLSRDDVTDILINAPGELWTETLGGGFQRHSAPDLNEATLWRLAAQIAALGHQGINRKHPILSATLPNGARVQVVAPPATRGPMALAIRKHRVQELSLEDYQGDGAFNLGSPRCHDELDAVLERLLEAGDIAGFLRTAVRGRKNIIVSGGTSTGKTTFLNTLVQEVPPDERLILIEDAAEIRLTHPNAVGLIAVKGSQGEARVDANDLLQASLRMRPDRIILGELRGDEAYSFLRAVNSGHPGSITTVHADTPWGAMEQIALMVMQSNRGLPRSEIIAYVEAVVGIVVQLARVDGKRKVSEIRFGARSRPG